MKWNSHAVLILALSSLVVSCASIPDAKLNYYHAKVTLDIEVTQTVLCKKHSDGNFDVYSSSLVSVSPQFVADKKSDPKSFAFKSLDGTFFDGEATVELTDDGRLSGINSTTSGQGKSIIEGATTIVSQVLGIGAGVVALDDDGNDLGAHPCELNGALAKGEPLTLTRKHTIADVRANVALGSDEEYQVPDYSGNYLPVNQLFPVVSISTSDVLATGKKPVEMLETKAKSPSITLKHPKMLRVESFVTTFEGKQKKSSSHTIPFPQKGDEFDVEMPKPGLFGNTAFELKLSDAGQITTLKYGVSDTGTQSIGGISALSGLFEKSAEQTEYEKTKAEADLIYQQQRLVRCKADPNVENCKS